MLSAIAARKAARPSVETSKELPRSLASSPPPPTSTREWSPSRPNDSEDLALQTKPECPATISNFTPVISQNIFLLTHDNISSLGFQGESAVLLTINPDESLALLGVYRVAVLQGAISLCGVTLRPSLTQHRVFAPRSSPIPVISWASMQRDELLSTCLPLPSNVHTNPDTAVILIQPENTGVHNLGRVCRVFEHVFQPPRDTTTVDIGVPAVHLVCDCRYPNYFVPTLLHS